MYKLIDKKGLVIKTSEKLKELHDVAVEKMNEEQGDSTFIQIAPKDGYVFTSVRQWKETINEVYSLLWKLY